MNYKRVDRINVDKAKTLCARDYKGFGTGFDTMNGVIENGQGNCDRKVVFMKAKVIRKPVNYENFCGNCGQILDDPVVDIEPITTTARNGKSMCVGNKYIMQRYCKNCGGELDWNVDNDSN